jgi:hypothetical protein
MGADDEQQLWLGHLDDAVAVDSRPDELCSVCEPAAQLGEGPARWERACRLGALEAAGPARQVRGDPVDMAVTEIGAKLGRGEGVEVIAAGEQQRVRDLLELGLATQRVNQDASAVGVAANAWAAGCAEKPGLRTHSHAGVL